MAQHEISLPFTDKEIKGLKVGDNVLISGTIFTARDAAHIKLMGLIDQKKPLPIDLKGQVIYYCGPTPAKPGHIIGSAGPTTSSRMDASTPQLLRAGLKATIGKGRRSKEVRDALKKNKAVYLVAAGGAAALLSKHIKKAKIAAYPELGPEAIYELDVKNFPVIVANDIYGKDIFEEGMKKYRK